jgi:hypothetical protein
MANENTINVHGFLIKTWHRLTELPKESVGQTNMPPVAASKQHDVKPLLSPLLTGVSELLRRLLWDILMYPFSSVSERMKRLGMSARDFERAKEEGLERKFFIQSNAGQTVYLIPTSTGFRAYNMLSPFSEGELLEHSFYTEWCAFLLQKNPRYKSVKTNVRIGEGNAAADLVSITHDSCRQVWEISLSTGNLLSNCTKYINTDFAQIIFLCRTYKLREAVRACCREGGLSQNLLSRLVFMHFSQLLKFQKKLGSY